MADQSRHPATRSQGAGRRTFLLGTGAAATAALAAVYNTPRRALGDDTMEAPR